MFAVINNFKRRVNKPISTRTFVLVNAELKKWGLLLLLGGIWGSSFILMKKGMFATDGTVLFTDSQVGALRMLIASLVLTPVAIYSLKKITSFKQIVSLTIVGFSGNFIPAFLFTYAETGLSSGFAGMLNSFTSIFTLLVGLFVFRTAIKTHQIIGIAIGTIGVIFLMIEGKNASISGTWWHVSAIVLATLCYAISLNTIKHTLQMLSSIEITSLAFSILLLPSFIVTYSVDTHTSLLQKPEIISGLYYIGILALIGTATAVVLFNLLISSSSALFASSVTYIIPIVAVFIGFFFNEKISWLQIAWMLVILIGVFVANYWENILLIFTRKNKEQ
jgi:drug/metabolite transporter (DMT)-like permease